MFLQTKTEVYNSEDSNLGIKPDHVTIDIIFRLSHLVGVRQFVVDGVMDPTRSVVILQTGEEYGISTPYSKVVALLCPPAEYTTLTNIDSTTFNWVAEPKL